ncbi:MAG: hypothetical protein QOH88_3088 [Verrucomicrobiota bacterium]|jgi:hypothetical protein
MGAEIIHAELPSRHFEPRVYGVGAWTSHLHFAYDLVATLKPGILVELGVDRGESYFAFCQSAAENKTGTRCFGVDSWQGDQHAGGYDETTFAQVSAHNRANYGEFSSLVRSSFDAALAAFAPESIDVLHLDGLHTEAAVRHDLESWLPKVRPGGIILLHDVEVRTRDFGVWKVWAELCERNRSWTFPDGPGLGIWQKPPAQNLPGFLDQLLAPPDEQNEMLAQYYRERAADMQRRIGDHWRDGTIRQTAFAQQTVIQVFYTKDGVHRQEDVVHARVGHDGWKAVTIQLPPGAGASPLRIDFVSAFTTIEIESIQVMKGGHVHYVATNESGFNSIALTGDVERLPHANALQFAVTGAAPRLYLPAIQLPEGEAPLVLQMLLRIFQG